MSDKHKAIHHTFFFDYRYDNDLFLFLSVITQKKEDSLYPYYIRKNVRITAMPMTKIKNYLQSPALYQYIDMDLTLRTINKNIMEDKGDNIFGVNCNDPIVLRSEKNLAVRKKKVNYNQYWIVHTHPDKDDNNIDLLHELNILFDSIFDTFEEND